MTRLLKMHEYYIYSRVNMRQQIKTHKEPGIDIDTRVLRSLWLKCKEDTVKEIKSLIVKNYNRDYNT